MFQKSGYLAAIAVAAIAVVIGLQGQSVSAQTGTATPTATASATATPTGTAGSDGHRNLDCHGDEHCRTDARCVPLGCHDRGGGADRRGPDYGDGDHHAAAEHQGSGCGRPHLVPRALLHRHSRDGRRYGGASGQPADHPQRRTDAGLGALAPGSHTVSVVLGQISHVACEARGSVTFNVAATSPVPPKTGTAGLLDGSDDIAAVFALLVVATMLTAGGRLATRRTQ